MNASDHWITVQEAAAYLRLGSPSAVYRHMRDNKLPYGRIGRHYRFKRSQLDAWVESKNGIVAAFQKRA